MAVNDVMRVLIRGTLHGQQIVNVLHYVHDVSVALDFQATLAGQVQNTLVPLFKACQSNEFAHVDVLVQKMWPLPPLVPAIDTGGVGVGGVAQNSLPTSMSVTITKRTQFAGRKYRGRIFVAGVPVTHEDNSSLAAASMGVWNALAAGLDTPLAGGGDTFAPVLWHKGTNSYHRVLDAQPRTILRNQRRRQIGKGV